MKMIRIDFDINLFLFGDRDVNTKANLLCIREYYYASYI